MNLDYGSDDIHQTAPYFIRPLWVFLLFLLGWEANVLIFSRYNVDFREAMRVLPDRDSPVKLFAALILACSFILILAVECIRAQILSTAGVVVVLLVTFFGSIGVFLTMRGPGYNARTGIRNALYRCIFPLSKVETPFMEVLLADGLTSLGKPLFDLGLGGCMLLTTSTQSSWGERAEVCTESSVLPYIFWAAPFIIRARQTWVSANASAGCRRMIHLTNFVKYTTAFPVMYYAFKYSRDIDRESETSLSVSRLYVESAWIFACVMNALYSLMWDLVMDWGLFQEIPRTQLRSTLMYPKSWYWIAIVLDLLGRSLWAVRYSPLGFTSLIGVEGVGACQVVEVARRLMWNQFRVEWEIVKLQKTVRLSQL
eukprot:GEMP01050158.1.p1 GENE.GEMP01050158.1~~GEMP01050158.1.p1  ORF type:complete len:369 (+),score=44.78 GEMP01050158.1:144-1250(+)